MNFTKLLADLRTERARIDQAIAAIEGISSTGRRRGRPAGTAARPANRRRGRPAAASAPKRRRRGMSAAARRKLSRLLKQRWAAGKMKRKKAA